MKKHIVKRRGHKEPYDERKVYGSVYAACMSAHLHEKQCEHVAEKVCKEISAWMEGQGAVDSKQVFEKIHHLLAGHHADAAFLYKTHRDIS